jgi:hypothetical protein
MHLQAASSSGEQTCIFSLRFVSFVTVFLSLLDVSFVLWGLLQNFIAAGEEVKEGSSEQGGGGAFSWVVRLVQEFCDLGSLRDALKGGKQFR